MDWKLEVVSVSVTDVDRAKRFYNERLGFAVDLEDQPRDDLRFVQLTPPGSACSIVIGTVIDGSSLGWTQGTQLGVADIDAARAMLIGGDS